jgi:hypothetical protein
MIKVSKDAKISWDIMHRGEILAKGVGIDSAPLPNDVVYVDDSTVSYVVTHRAWKLTSDVVSLLIHVTPR